MDRVCVIGGHGFIGKALSEILLKQDCKCHLPRSNEIDLDNFVSLKTYFHDHPANRLIHLAWVTAHGKFWNSPENALWIQRTKNLVQAFYESGGERVVVAGTCAEYDWGNKGLLSEHSSCFCPSTFYGRCKLEMQIWLEEFCESKRLEWGWGRIFFPYGPDENKTKLISSLIQALRKEQSAFGVNLLVERDFVYVRDVAQAFFTLAYVKQNGIFNIGSGQGISIRSIVETLGSVLNEDPTPILMLKPTLIDPVQSIVADNSKLKMLGWTPEFDIIRGLESYIGTLSMI